MANHSFVFGFWMEICEIIVGCDGKKQKTMIGLIACNLVLNLPIERIFRSLFFPFSNSINYQIPPDETINLIESIWWRSMMWILIFFLAAKLIFHVDIYVCALLCGSRSTLRSLRKHCIAYRLRLCCLYVVSACVCVCVRPKRWHLRFWMRTQMCGTETMESECESNLRPRQSRSEMHFHIEIRSNAFASFRIGYGFYAFLGWAYGGVTSVKCAPGTAIFINHPYWNALHINPSTRRFNDFNLEKCEHIALVTLACIA